jgi:quercetin dioxygenase-like cupin family protein
MSNKNKKWVLRDEVTGAEVAPGVIRTILAYDDNIMGAENQFEKGAVGAMHSHPHTQLTYILSGVFEFTVGDDIKIVKAGDTLLKIGGIVHGCVCLESGAMLDVFTPMREDFV